MNKLPSCLSLSLLLWVVAAPHAAAQSAGLEIEGKYELVEPPQPTETGDRIEVVEVFGYACPHCYAFLASMEEFERNKPAYVEVRRLPAVFRESWVPHARAYYISELLKVREKTHRALYEEIHERRNPTDYKDALGTFYARHGVDRALFNKTFDSFAVESMIRESVLMQQRYGIRGTPTVVVNGKYQVTGRLAGSLEGIIAVVRALVEREHEARGGDSG